MIDHYYLNLALISLCLAIVMSCVFIAIVKLKKRKKILQALQNTSAELKVNLENHQQNLKKAVENLTDEAVTNCINEIYLIEKESLNKLISLTLDDDVAAIEMTPVLSNQIIAKYIHCIKQVVLASLVPTAALETEYELERFQFESLTEQLRSEKHDYADKYKAAHDLLRKVYLNYKDKLEINNDRPLEELSLEEMAVVFDLKWTPPRTEYC